MKDLYALLGIPASATREQIRQAYRDRAKMLHPDVNPDPEAKHQFQMVQSAYNVLYDPLSRRLYDWSLSAPSRTPSPVARQHYEPVIEYDYTRIVTASRIWSLVLLLFSLTLAADLLMAKWTPLSRVEAFRITGQGYFGSRYQIRTTEGLLEAPSRAFASLKQGDEVSAKISPLFHIVSRIRQHRSGPAGFSLDFHPKFGSFNPYPILALALMAAAGMNVIKKHAPTTAMIVGVIGAWLLLTNLVMIFL